MGDRHASDGQWEIGMGKWAWGDLGEIGACKERRPDEGELAHHSRVHRRGDRSRSPCTRRGARPHHTRARPTHRIARCIRERARTRSYQRAAPPPARPPRTATTRPVRSTPTPTRTSVRHRKSWSRPCRVAAGCCGRASCAARLPPPRSQAGCERCTESGGASSAAMPRRARGQTPRRAGCGSYRSVSAARRAWPRFLM